MLLLIPTTREARALFDGGRAPRCEDPETLELGGRPVRTALVGFGPAAAGVLAALALARERPRHVLLAGVAGSYHLERAGLGTVFEASGARFADLGAGRGAVRRSAEQLGFEQAPPAAGRPAVGDLLPLAGLAGLGLAGLGLAGLGLEGSGRRAPLPALPRGELLTVAASSGSREEARERALAFPEALGEDMEAFSVALAAQRLGIPLAVVRAVSNAAGEADRARWDLPGALAALRAWLVAALPLG